VLLKWCPLWDSFCWRRPIRLGVLLFYLPWNAALWGTCPLRPPSPAATASDHSHVLLLANHMLLSAVVSDLCLCSVNCTGLTQSTRRWKAWTSTTEAVVIQCNSPASLVVDTCLDWPSTVATPTSAAGTAMLPLSRSSCLVEHLLCTKRACPLELYSAIFTSQAQLNRQVLQSAVSNYSAYSVQLVAVWLHRSMAWLKHC